MASLQLRNPALRVFEVAKDNGLGGACLLACSLDVAIGEITLSLQGNVLGQLDPLHAHAALFHHSPGAHRHIWVQHHAAQGVRHVEIKFLVFRVVVPVEAPHLVWAVVGAIARANAAVVDLLVQALRTRGGGQDRADGLARGILAVLAHHGLMNTDRIFLRTAVITVNSDPMHDAASFNLVLSHYGNIVLCLAGNHTC